MKRKVTIYCASFVEKKKKKRCWSLVSGYGALPDSLKAVKPSWCLPSARQRGEAPTILEIFKMRLNEHCGYLTLKLRLRGCNTTVNLSQEDVWILFSFYVRWGKCWYTILDILVHLHWLLFFWMVNIVSLFENVLDNVTGFKKWTMCLIFGPFTWILKVHCVVLGKKRKIFIGWFCLCLNKQNIQTVFVFMTE